jgi:DNA-binding winged helix-turn-helix (wHTH) protein/TolB-like protein/Flp pilus assembly protein TadD
MAESATRRYRFEGYSLDTRSRELRAATGDVVPLTAKAFETLRFLVEHSDRVVSKDELFEAVWPGRVVEENNLTQAIAALRRAFGTNAGEHRFIVTVPGRGYRFVADVDGDPGQATAEPLAAPSPRVHRHAWAWVGLTLALVGIAGIAIVGMREPPPSPASPEAALAVLPFRSLSMGARDELLELGLAETLINRISSSTKLRVRSLGSSQRFAGPQQDPIDAARQLGARYVVEGTTQRHGDRVRVTARLLDARTGDALWAETFDESMDRVFTLQDSIAASMAGTLALSENTRRRRSPCDGDNAEAYRAYLTGRHQGNRPSGQRMRQALASFRHAIELDPSCARAYAGMAYSYRTGVMTADRDPRVDFPLAKAAVDQALRIDPNLAEAYSSQGFIRFWYDWDWAGAEASLRHAIALNPSLAEAHFAYAHLLNNLGRHEEATIQARQAIALDPLSPLFNALASTFASMAGHEEEARALAQKSLEVEPDFWIALLVRSHPKASDSDYSGAVEDTRRATEGCGNCAQSASVYAIYLAHSGDRAGAEAILADMERRAREGYYPATGMAGVHNALGRTDKALDLLELAYEQRDVRMVFLAIDDRWDNLRDHPRFRALMERMHFPAQKDQVTDNAVVRGAP